MTLHSFRNQLPLLTGIFALSFSLVGCQSFQPKNPGELALKNDAFIDLWDEYNQCVIGSNAADMLQSLQILHSAPSPISLEDSPIPIPKFLKEWTSARNSRLSVDPRAMAASCSIHIAEAARQSSDWHTALSTLQAIIKNYPEPQYAFYVSKASRAIEQFSSIQPVSLQPHNRLIH